MIKSAIALLFKKNPERGASEHGSEGTTTMRRKIILMFLHMLKHSTTIYLSFPYSKDKRNGTKDELLHKKGTVHCIVQLKRRKLLRFGSAPKLRTRRY
jgi:hypothetical protein